MWLGNDRGAKRKTSDGKTNKQTGSTSSALFKVGQGTGGNVSSAELEMGARFSLCLTSLLSPMWILLLWCGIKGWEEKVS